MALDKEKGGKMTAKSLKVPADVYNGLTRTRITIADTLGRIPTMGEIINVLVIVGNKHVDELIETSRQAK